MKIYFCDLETGEELEELDSSNINKIKNYSKVIGLAITDLTCLYYIVYIDESTKFKIKIKNIAAFEFSGLSSKHQVGYFEWILEKLWFEKTKEDESSNDYFYC